MRCPSAAGVAERAAGEPREALLAASPRGAPADGGEAAASPRGAPAGGAAADAAAPRGAGAPSARGLHLRGALVVAFEQMGRCWICLVCLLFLGMLCVIVWSQLMYENVNDDQCDHPLKMMLRMLYVIVGILAFQKEIVSNILCYSVERNGPVEPCRVVVFRQFLYLATALWPMAALWMLAEVKKCDSQLRLAVTVILVYVAVMAFVIVLVPVLSAAALLCLVRRGLLRLPRSPTAAPDDLIERLPSPRYDPDLFDDSGRPSSFPSACSICLEAFSDSPAPIVRTPCGAVSHHAYHRDCLRDWLQRARTCPLCRKDLVEAVDGPGAPSDDGAGV